MNKGELVDAVSGKTSVTKNQAEVVLSAAIETIGETVAKGEEVRLERLGSFKAREQKARKWNEFGALVTRARAFLPVKWGEKQVRRGSGLDL